MKGLAIYKLERVGSAVDRLDAAVARLEQALARQPESVPEGEAGAEIAKLRAELDEAQARNKTLKANADQVGEKLDGVIARIETLVKEA